MGQGVIIEDGVKLGKNCQIGHYVVIHEGSKIGDNVRIDDFAVIGKRPMRAANSAMTHAVELNPTEIGSGCLIGTGAILYRGCTLAERVLVADQASIRENVTVGEKVIVGRSVTIENNCQIGKMSKIESHAYITAFSTIGENCFIAPCVATSNDPQLARGKKGRPFKGVTLEDGARIGVHGTTLPGVILQTNAAVAAASLVTKNIDSGEFVKGVPAKKFKDVPSQELLENWLEENKQ